MIIYAVTLIWISITIGVEYKLIALRARKSLLFIAPVLPFFSLIFNIRFAYKSLRQNNRKYVLRKIAMIIIYSFRDISIITGILCGVIADNKIGIKGVLLGLFEKEPHFFSDKIKKIYTRYEKIQFRFSE